MGSDGSHFNVFLIVRDKIARVCPQITTFEEKGEPKRNRAEVLLLTSRTPRPDRLTLAVLGCPSLTFHNVSGVDVKAELGSCVKVEVAVLGSRP